MSFMQLNTSKIGQIRVLPRFSPEKPKFRQQTRPSCGARVGNSPSALRQLALFCPCGALPPLTAGLCTSCYWRWKHSLRFFGGRRDEVLGRDDRRCRACGSDRWVGVHHRRPGSNAPTLLLCLCAACHVQVHRLLSIWKWIPALVADLWAEQHSGAPVQMQFDQLGLPQERREVGSLPGGQFG